MPVGRPRSTSRRVKIDRYKLIIGTPLIIACGWFLCCLLSPKASKQATLESVSQAHARDAAEKEEQEHRWTYSTHLTRSFHAPFVRVAKIFRFIYITHDLRALFARRWISWCCFDLVLARRNRNRTLHNLRPFNLFANRIPTSSNPKDNHEVLY